MKILIISDIHGNLHALNSVLESTPHDLVICCGDLVVGYPFPDKCIEKLRCIGARVCMGNHDFDIALDRKTTVQMNNQDPHISSALDQSAELTRECIGECEKTYLKNLPREQLFTVDGITFYMNHTAPSLSLHHYISPDTSEEEMTALYSNIQADILITGHTHIPYVKKIGYRQLINPGSVGEPRDGDLRAGYAVFDTDTSQVMLHRLAYDTSETIRILLESGYPDYSLSCLKYGALPK